MLFQINATLFSGIEKFYSAKVQKNDKTKKKKWENAKGECFWDPHFEMQEKNACNLDIFSEFSCFLP